MGSPENKRLSNTEPETSGPTIRSKHIDRRSARVGMPALLLLCLLGTSAWSQNTPSVDGYDRLNPEGLMQIDRISEALHQAGIDHQLLQDARVGIVLGTTVGCTFHDEDYYSAWRDGLVAGWLGIKCQEAVRE